MGKRRAVITGVGVVSPVGNDKDTFWKSLLEGKSGVDRLSAFDPTHFTTHIAAEVKDFDATPYFNTPKDARRMDRFIQFAVAAAVMSKKDASLDIADEEAARAGVIIGSGIGGLHTIETAVEQYVKNSDESKAPGRITPFLIPMLICDMASGQVSMYFNAKGPNYCTTSACASAAHAIGESLRKIQQDEADIMVTGGVDAAITPLGFGGFCAARSLSKRNDNPTQASRPFDQDRDGFVMGEGAGILIVEEYKHAKKRGAPIYCELIGYGCSGDAHHMTAPPPDGNGAQRAMSWALKDAGINPDQVDYINAHGTSTVMNDKIETFAIKQVFNSHAHKLAISSTKSVTGHLLGAAGGIEAIATAFALKEGVLPPTINLDNPASECDLDYVPKEPRKANAEVALSNSFGFGGHNVSIAFRKTT